MHSSFGRAIASMSTHRSILSPTSFRITPSTCLRRPPNPYMFPSLVSFRHQSDRVDSRPRPPEVNLKSQDSEIMNELQKEQGIKKQQGNTRKLPKPDILAERELSKSEQRKVNWGILKTLVKYIWPKVQMSSGEKLMIG